MENDLFFKLIKTSDWKAHSSRGSFEPEEYQDFGKITCYVGDQVQDIANSEFFGEENELFLVVIDPLRIQVPVKYESKKPVLYGSFSIDAVIDRIKIKREKDGRFYVSVKHFD